MDVLSGKRSNLDDGDAGPRTHRFSPERLLLAIILAVAFALRIRSVAFGLPALNDPDELTFELAAVHMLKDATLNPGWFGHPATTTIYLMALINVGTFISGDILGWFSSVRGFGDALYADPTLVILPGRIAMVLFSITTIYLTYRLARDLSDRRTGLAAAALLAVSPVHVAWSQIIRSDIMASCFMLLCALAALRILREGRWRDYVLASLWLGVAVATKWPSAVAALAVAGVLVRRAIDQPSERSGAAARFGLFGAMSIGFMLLTSPFMLLDYPTLIHNLHGEVQVHHLGATGGTPWENLWWYIHGPIWKAFGGIGLVFTLWGLTIIGRRREACALIIPVVFGLLLMLCVQRLVWERWALPLLPFLAIASAAGLMALARLGAHHLPALPEKSAVLAICVITLLFPVLRAEADTRARLNDTRQIASQWARAHIPAGSTVMIEHFAFDLQPMPWRFLFPLGDAGCIDAKMLLHSHVQMSTIAANRGARSNIDYGTVAAAKRYTCRADYAILTQYDSYAAERTAFPAEYDAYRELLARGTLVATFAPQDGRFGGPVVRIVRFAR